MQEKFAFQNPELLLRGLNAKLRALKRSLLFADEGKTDLQKELNAVIQKIHIAELLSNNYVIAVTGLQGAGKTTLIKQLYDIGDDWLPENIGRGEKMPVLVRESNVEECCAKAQRIFITPVTEAGKEVDRQVSIEEVSIDQSEFVSLLRSPSAETILPILEVPPKVFGSMNKSFVLLPGYEEETRENRNWQGLMRHTLMSSATCIFVVNETRLADFRNEKLMEEIRDRIFSGGKPLVTISGADLRTEEQCAAMSDQLMDKLCVRSEEADRIINTGTFTDGQTNNQWINKLTNALAKYSATEHELRQQQLEHLDGVLRDDLGDVLDQAKEILESSRISQNREHRHIDSLMEIFDRQVDDLKNKYQKAVQKKLNALSCDARDKTLETLKDKGFFQRLKERFWSNSINLQLEMESLIKTSWGTAEGQPFSLQHVEILNDLVAQEFNLLKAFPEDSTTDRHALLGQHYLTTDEQPEIVSQEVQDNLKMIFSPRETGHGMGFDLKANQKLEASIRAIPALTLELARISSIYPEYFGHNFGSATDDMPTPTETLQSISADFNTLKGSYGGIIKGIAAIIGVDLLQDGQIDTIPALLGALGVGGEAAAAETATAGAVGVGASAVSMWVGGLVAAAFLAISIQSQLNKVASKEAAFAQQAIGMIRDSHFTEFRDNFDGMMKSVRDIFYERLRNRLQLPNELARVDNLNKAFADVREARIDTREALSDTNEWLGNALQTA
jgi:hypothetical protein